MKTTTPPDHEAVLLKGHGASTVSKYATTFPSLMRAGQVLVQVAAAGVSNTDINTRIGWYAQDIVTATPAGSEAAVPTGRADVSWAGEIPTFPRIQGADACGRIVAVGSGVDASRIGERIIVEPVFRDPADPRAQPVYFGSEVDGAFAEYTVVPSRHAVHVDCTWTDVELASIPCSYSAAENMLTRVKAAAGETVVITGASGGVGSAALQLTNGAVPA